MAASAGLAWPVVTSLDTACRARLDLRLAREQADSRLPSLVGGIVREGALSWWGSAGTVEDAAPDADTQYRIGSITKTFVAVAVLRLRDEGVVDLDDRVEDHVPGTPVGRATVAQLLSHASGLQAETDGPWWERSPGGPWPELVDAMSPAWARHRPGRRFHYSNAGYAVLGELVARHRATPWHDAVRTELLDPLGMRRTTPRPQAPHAGGLAVHPWADIVLAEPEHDAGAMAPAGQLWSTVEDLARWAAFLAGDGAGVISPDTLAEMRRPLVIDDVPGAAWTGGYGLGLQVWNTDGRRSYGHGGSMPGFLAVLRVDAESGDAAVVATNSTAGLSATFATDLLDVVAEHAPRRPEAWQPSAVESDLLALTGAWFWGPTPLALYAGADGGLEVRDLGKRARTSRFRPAGDGTWTGLDGYYAGETLRVVRRADGEVSHLDIASFVLTRTPYDPRADVPGGVDVSGWRGSRGTRQR